MNLAFFLRPLKFLTSRPSESLEHAISNIAKRIEQLVLTVLCIFVICQMFEWHYMLVESVGEQLGCSMVSAKLQRK